MTYTEAVAYAALAVIAHLPFLAVNWFAIRLSNTTSLVAKYEKE